MNPQNHSYFENNAATPEESPIPAVQVSDQVPELPGRSCGAAASGISLIAKRPDEVGKAITSAALVETYAIFAVLVSLLMVVFAKV